MANSMALEQKIDRLVDRFEGLSDKVDGLSGKFDGLATRVDALSDHVDKLAEQVGGLTGEVGGLKGGVGELKSKVTVGFEESHRLLKLSREGLGALEETTVARFDKMSDEHGQQFDLLKEFGVHVRRRVERLETPTPRRRR